MCLKCQKEKSNENKDERKGVETQNPTKETNPGTESSIEKEKPIEEKTPDIDINPKTPTTDKNGQIKMPWD